MPVKTTPPSGDPPPFHEFEHTGDMGIELNAPTRVELFRRAVIALASLLVETSTVMPAQQREVTVAAETDPDLMHDLLTELLGLFTLDGFIWRDASASASDRSVHVKLRGEHLDLDRHQFRGEIKAVTYHQLAVERSSGGWRARVIFDV